MQQANNWNYNATTNVLPITWRKTWENVLGYEFIGSQQSWGKRLGR